MPPLTYSGLEFFHFWRNVSLESLTHYSLRLESAFRDHYQKVGFSAEEFVRTLQPHLKHFDPHSNVDYGFDVEKAGDQQIWRIKLRLTQISHFEGGIVRASPVDLNERLALTRDLIERDLANVISVSEFVKAKGIRRFLGKTIAGRLVGPRVPMYLWQKLLDVNSLRKKLRWEPLDQRSFDFFAFADRVARVFHPDHAQIVELSYGREKDEVRAFMQHCDAHLKSYLVGDELKKTFALIGISPDEWFTS